MSGHTRHSTIRNEIIRRKKVGIVPVVEKNVESRLKWFGYVLENPIRWINQVEDSPIVKGRNRFT